MARWQTLPSLLFCSLHFLSFSASHSLLKRLSHCRAFCCGESGEVAQCVLVKAVPHLPAIIRQLYCEEPPLIPLWRPLLHHKEISLFVYLSQICPLSFPQYFFLFIFPSIAHVAHLYYWSRYGVFNKKISGSHQLDQSQFSRLKDVTEQWTKENL